MAVGETTFTLLSDVGDYEEVQLGEGDAQVLRIEDVYMEAGDCEPGDRIGQVYIEETDTGRGNRVLVTATFDLDDGDSFIIQGIAQRIVHNDRPSFKGRLSVGGGTGKFKGRPGQADVDVCNPKRWIVATGP